MKSAAINAFFAVCMTMILAGCSSPELINSASREKPVIIDAEIASPVGLAVFTGFRDSVYFKGLIAKYPELTTDQVKKENPELDARGVMEQVIENTKQHTQRFVLSWGAAENAETYEVRAYNEPITAENWTKALPVSFSILSSEGGLVTASVPLSKSSVLPGKCINCGECVKSCPFGAISTINGKSVVDPAKCTSCGECWTSCKYSALDGLFAGQAYYFAVRSVGKDGAVSPGTASSKSAYMVRYTTMSAIPDSVKETPSAANPMKSTLGWPLTSKGKLPDGKGGCFGNCNIIYDTTNSAECIGGCYIVYPLKESWFKGPESKESVCPTDAIYTVTDSAEADRRNTSLKAIFINQDKCINCGNCMVQCKFEGFGAVTTETVEAPEKVRTR